MDFFLLMVGAEKTKIDGVVRVSVLISMVFSMLFGPEVFRIQL
jgi:hypothetical protein